MLPHCYRSNRTLPGVGVTLLLAVTLASCRRGTDTPRASARPELTASAPVPAPPPRRELTWNGKVDMKLWSGIRVRTYKAALTRPTPPMLAILRARDRAAAGTMAPPHGLCLWEVGYPAA